jgi:hypothetical protein
MVNKVHIYVISDTFPVGIIIHYILLSMVLHIIPSIYTCQSTLVWTAVTLESSFLLRIVY